MAPRAAPPHAAGSQKHRNIYGKKVKLHPCIRVQKLHQHPRIEVSNDNPVCIVVYCSSGGKDGRSMQQWWHGKTGHI